MQSVLFIVSQACRLFNVSKTLIKVQPAVFKLRKISRLVFAIFSLIGGIEISSSVQKLLAKQSHSIRRCFVTLRRLSMVKLPVFLSIVRLYRHCWLKTLFLTFESAVNQTVWRCCHRRGSDLCNPANNIDRIVVRKSLNTFSSILYY